MELKNLNIVNMVREDYASVAKGGDGCFSGSCCGKEADSESLLEAGKRLGYTKEQLEVGLGEANLGLGCGNPQAIADLRAGTVQTIVEKPQPSINQAAAVLTMYRSLTAPQYQV